MGNGNLERAERIAAPMRLLTPHGEREPARPLHSPDRAAHLLTPHGEREPERTWAKGRAEDPPNPSWGTGTGA